jgi:hypothetical protein
MGSPHNLKDEIDSGRDAAVIARQGSEVKCTEVAMPYEGMQIVHIALARFQATGSADHEAPVDSGREAGWYGYFPNASRLGPEKRGSGRVVTHGSNHSPIRTDGIGLVKQDPGRRRPNVDHAGSRCPQEGLATAQASRHLACVVNGVGAGVADDRRSKVDRSSPGMRPQSSMEGSGLLFL